MARHRDEWAREALGQNLKTEAITIIQSIADGHNDPRTLCADYLQRLADFRSGK